MHNYNIRFNLKLVVHIQFLPYLRIIHFNIVLEINRFKYQTKDDWKICSTIVVTIML